MAGTAGLDERYISTNALEQYFVDKDSGAPLAGGSVEFWQDDSRATPKLVYQLTGDPSNVGGYSYDPLPNPVTLSGVGTIQNAGGDNIALYYYPYDSQGNIELYYVVVKDYLGVVQFTRSGWPNVIGSQDPTASTALQTNQISNSQFVDFTSYNDDTSTITYTGSATNSVEVAPDWVLTFTHTGSGSLTLAREAIAGSSNYPTNPPYWFVLTPGANITSISLVQNMPHNPAIWATTDDGVVGYVAGGLLLDVGTYAGLYYVPSAGTPTEYELVNITNNTGSQKYFTGTKEIVLSTNTDTSTNGGISIVIRLSPTNVSRLSSVQILGLNSADEDVPYIQETVNRQQDFLFHYYKDPLIEKAISSYLTGWDFPLNPAQFGGRTQAASLGINESKYVWDQTIMYQSVAASFAVSGTSLGAIQLQNQAVSAAKFALVQYMDQEQARKILANQLSVQISGCTNMADGLGVTVSLWYTTDASLPLIGSNLSIVGTLNSTGKPITFNGAWTEVPTDHLVDHYGVIPFGTNNEGEPLNFSYWDASTTAAPTTATFFAIVVGSAAVDASAVVSFRSVSLVPGTIATAPAPQTRDQVLRECQYYYQKSYTAATAPGTAANYVGMKSTAQSAKVNIDFGTSSDSFTPIYTNFELAFKASLRKIPTLTVYSPVTGASANVSYSYINNFAVQTSVDKAITNWSTATPFGSSSVSNTVFNSTYTGTGLGNLNEPLTSITYHYVADARLGVI